MNKKVSQQHIHNILVSNFHFDKAEELHDILTIIISSFINDELIKYYSLKDDMITKEFVNLLIENSKNILGNEDNKYDKYFEVITKIEFKDCFKICKTIYDSYQNDYTIISKLFQQFKKYNSYSLSKNEVWTEPEIARIMFHELMKNISDTKNISICDPCIGGGNLLIPFIENYKNINIIGCDINSNLALNMKLELMIKGIQNKNIHDTDYFKVDTNSLNSDIVICNPPYTKKISKHDCLEFVNRTLTHSKYCSYIIPKNKLFIERKELERLIENYSIISIIELGEIFKSVASTGDIIILTCSSNKTNDKTKYINMSNLADEHKKVIRSNEYKFTDKGNELLNSYYEDKINVIEYIPTVDQPYPNDTKNIIEVVKTNVINELTKSFLFTKKNQYLSNDSKKTIENIFRKHILNIKNCKNIIDLMKILYKYDFDHTVKIKLSNYFNLVKKTKNYKYKTTDKSSGDIPLFACKKLDNGIARYVENEEYEGDIIAVVHHRDATCGYSFHYSGKLAWNTSIFIIELKEELRSKINLDYIADYLTLTISPNHTQDESFTKDELMNFEIEYPEILL